MSQNTFPSLSEAISELELIRTTTSSVLDQLRGGVGLDAAYMIIDRYWEGAEASKLKTRLSGQFPKDNGYVIQSANFSDKLGVALSLDKTKAYLAGIFPAIATRIEEIYDHINSKDLNDTAALLVLNDFRKEPARFMDFITSGWYEQRDKVVKGEITDWDGLREYETDSIDSGDYLFLTDYRKELSSAQERMQEDLFGYNTPSTYSMGGIDECMSRFIGMVKMIGLFVAYLERATVSPDGV